MLQLEGIGQLAIPIVVKHRLFLISEYDKPFCDQYSCGEACLRDI